MAFTAWRTWTTNELVSAALLNAQIRDNGIAGVPDIFTTAGDIAYATAADTAARLGIGTALQLLRTNAGATAPEWAADPSTAHIAASAAVHGLPASVNVLGNRSAAGEFVQRSTVASMTTSGAISFYHVSSAVTFAVAFSATPIVCPGGTTSDVVHFGGVQAVTTTGFSYRRLSNTDSQAASNIGWIALGT
mgnify:FL=1